MSVSEQPMTNTAKFQHIHSFPRIKREWTKGDLSKEEKLYVLDGMDLGLTESWILSLIEEAREMRGAK